MGSFSKDFSNSFDIKPNIILPMPSVDILKKIKNLTQINKREWDSYLLAKNVQEILTILVNNSKAEIIHADTDTSVNNYLVPDLTVDQVIKAYNDVVAGRGVIITNSTDMMHCYVNQADVINDEVSIMILYYDTMLLTYTVSGDTVDITYKVIPE